MAKVKQKALIGVYKSKIPMIFSYPSPKGIQIVLVSVEADKKD